jgi:chaperone BCS1
MDYFESLKITRDLRVLKFLSGRWGDETALSIGIGVGIHLIKIKNKYVLLTVREKDTQYIDEKLNITLTMFGKQNDFFEELRLELYELKNNKKGIPGELLIYTLTNDSTWRESIHSEQRRWDTVYLPKTQKEGIISFVKTFYESKKIYQEKGIPYQAGIILYGPPGTGKTSVIKGIASYFDKNICYLRASELSKLQEALIDLPKSSILVIEDVDTNPLVTSRENIKNSKLETSFEPGVTTQSLLVKQTTLSDILNLFDGIVSIPERLLIMTTNNIESIDKALLRPGRIDCTEKIDYVTREVFVAFLHKMFPGEDLSQLKESSGSLHNKELTIAKLQNNYFVDKFSINEFISNYW